MDIQASERLKYQAVWGDKQYREVSPGTRHLASAIEWLRPAPGSTFTDWGCGTGRAADGLFAAGFDVRLVDIAGNAYIGALPFVEACLWDLPESLGATDYGFCADVMEHIPPDHVDTVLEGIARRTRVACYFQIALFHDNHFTRNGQLHLSVFPPEWWIETLSVYFGTLETRMVKRRHLLAVCRP
jgi:hypothetical protein